MKIIINKSAAAARKKQVLNDILKKAQETAAKGMNNFVYHFKEGERASFPPPHMTFSIQDASQNSLKCAYRGDFGTHMKIIIQ